MENSIAINYTDSVVAFIDVLGFRRILKDKSIVETYFSKLIESLKTLKSSKITSLLISDSVVLQIPYHSVSDLRAMCVTVAHLQADLALSGIWTRGGIAIGNFYYETIEGSQVVAGEALADAYELESKWAKYPRVLLDPKIFNRLKMDRSVLNREIYRKGEVPARPLYDPMDHTDDAGIIPNSSLQSDGMWVDFAPLLFTDETRIRIILERLRKDLYGSQEFYDKFRWVQLYLSSVLYRSEYKDQWDHVWTQLESDFDGL